MQIPSAATLEDRSQAELAARVQRAMNELVLYARFAGSAWRALPEAREAARALELMSDRDLRDIGISRHQIPTVVRCGRADSDAVDQGFRST